LLGRGRARVTGLLGAGVGGCSSSSPWNSSLSASSSSSSGEVPRDLRFLLVEAAGLSLALLAALGLAAADLRFALTVLGSASEIVTVDWFSRSSSVLYRSSREALSPSCR